MKKKFFLLCVSCLLIGTALSPSLEAADSIRLAAPSAVLLDGKSQRIIYARAPHTRRAPASTTKLVTIMVVLDHLSPDQIVQIPGGLESIPPSKIGLRAGEHFYVRDLVKAALIRSANDAAETLAILVGGSRAGFAQLMNVKAKAVGANNSHFVNPSGLPASDHYSTAYDLARIIMAATRYPFIVNTLKIRSTVVRSVEGRRIPLNNCNKMLWRTSGVIGKTGWTRSARHCFAGRVQSGDRVIFAGLMGSEHRQYLWSDLRSIESFSSGKALRAITPAPPLSSRKDTVRIQKALHKAGYFKGQPTGFYGKRTKASVRSFQKANGLPALGTVGPQTWTKLEAFL